MKKPCCLANFWAERVRSSLIVYNTFSSWCGSAGPFLQEFFSRSATEDMSFNFLIVNKRVFFETSNNLAILRCDNFSSYNLCKKDFLTSWLKRDIVVNKIIYIPKVIILKRRRTDLSIECNETIFRPVITVQSTKTCAQIVKYTDLRGRGMVSL